MQTLITLPNDTVKKKLFHTILT